VVEATKHLFDKRTTPAFDQVHPIKFTHLTLAISKQSNFNVFTGEAVMIFNRVMDQANVTWNVRACVVDLGLAGYQTAELLKLLARQIPVHATPTCWTSPLYMFTLLLFQVSAYRAMYTGND